MITSTFTQTEHPPSQPSTSCACQHCQRPRAAGEGRRQEWLESWVEGQRTLPNTLLGGSYQAQSFLGSPVGVHSYCGFTLSTATTGLEDRTLPQQNECFPCTECSGRQPLGISSSFAVLQIGPNSFLYFIDEDTEFKGFRPACKCNISVSLQSLVSAQ